MSMEASAAAPPDRPPPPILGRLARLAVPEGSGRAAGKGLRHPRPLVPAGQLRTIAAVAEMGSLRGAATRLVVTESAVSAALGALQRQLGVRLVEREGRGARLTAAGRRYADYAGRVLGLLDEAALAAIAEDDPEAGSVRVAAVVSAGELLLPRALAAFREAHPRVGVDLEVGPRDRVWALLRSHAVDLAVAGRPPEMSPVRTLAVRRNELLAVAAPTLAVGTRSPRTAPWLLREPGSGTRDTLEVLLDDLGAAGPRLTLGSNGAVLAGARAGLGMCLVARDAVEDDLVEARLVQVAVPGTPLQRPYHLVGHRDVVPTARRFVEHLVGSHEWEPVAGAEAIPPAPAGAPAAAPPR